MKYMELIAPCHFGMEAVLKREILDLGYEISKVEDGKVTFLADAEGIAQANMFLRTTERILLKTGEFKAVTFDELFEKTKAIPWEEYIPKDGKFWVAKANSVKSALFSPSDIQSIMKKAIVERLKSVYGISWFQEDGASFPIRVAFMKDVATIGIDTSGVSLHKRGYRQMTVKAPITETLASALIMLTPWNKDRILVDPFCGSGTFPIEAAMIAADMAPGMNRSFLAEDWKHLVPRKCWYDALEEAQDRVNLDIDTDIPIATIAFYSAKQNEKDLISQTKLYDEVHKITKEINKIENVALVDLKGEKKEQFNVLVDANKLASYNLPLGLVMKQIQSLSYKTPNINTNTQDSSIVVFGIKQAIEDEKDLENLIISYNFQTPIYLKDIAKIEKSYDIQNKKEALIYQRNSNNNFEEINQITLSASKLKGTNSVTINKEIFAYMDSIKDEIGRAHV